MGCGASLSPAPRRVVQPKFEYFDEFYKTYLDDRHMILLGIIWVALAGYISQDIIKANMAYEHGMKILKEFLNNYGK